MREMVLNIITPQNTYGPYHCDSIHLCIADDLNGKGGGSYGIRFGHVQSLLSLNKGNLKAFKSSELCITGVCGKGFATIENNTIDVVVESFKRKDTR